MHRWPRSRLTKNNLLPHFFLTLLIVVFFIFLQWVCIMVHPIRINEDDHNRQQWPPNSEDSDSQLCAEYKQKFEWKELFGGKRGCKFAREGRKETIPCSYYLYRKYQRRTEEIFVTSYKNDRFYASAWT